jgi:hypothetical protein
MKAPAKLILASILGSGLGFPATASADDDAPPLSIYGFARLDAILDDSRMSNVTTPDFVALEPAEGQLDSELVMTPRLSRVGLSIDKWELKGEKITGEGKLEIDFAGGGDDTEAIRLRHAYGAVMFEKEIQLLAGLTWDLMSPLYPSVQNDHQLRYAGNLGDRRPQARLELFPGDKVHIGIGAAANGALDRMDLDGDGQLDGLASGLPMLQWLVEYRMRARGDVARFGISGHAARTELANGTTHGGKSIAAHAFVPMSKTTVLLGEGYIGDNLADLGGGIGQGVDPMTNKPIRSVGGWLELAMLPTKRHMLALGASIDTADDVETGALSKNQTTYAALRYKPRPAIQLGVDYLYWKTRFEQMGYGVANRVNLHASVFF